MTFKYSIQNFLSPAIFFSYDLTWAYINNKMKQNTHMPPHQLASEARQYNTLSYKGQIQQAISCQEILLTTMIIN